MTNCQTRESDRLSELPVFLLHHILSSLPRKDAARTSVLSKQWNSVWHSFPILRFDVDEYIKDGDDAPGFLEKLEKFLNLVDKSLQNFTQTKLRMEVFDLYSHLIDEKSIPMIDTWIPLALHNGASHISFTVNAKLSGFRAGDYPLPETTFVVKSICGSSRFYQLQTLELSMVYLSENIVRDIIHNCPNISDLCFWYFHGLKTLEISKLEKLKKLCIGVDGREVECLSVDAPLLENLDFFSYGPSLPCLINLNSRRALKSLKLSMCDITDDLLSSYISTSPLLEHVRVYNCHMLRRPRISAQRLKTLELYECSELEVVQIHAPNLSKFEFITHKNMPILFSENVIPCSVKINYHIRYTNAPFDSFWFLKLREFLRVSAEGVLFSLCVIENEVSFDPEALRDVAIPPLVIVDLLEICSRRSLSQFDCATLIDGLLWSCHPKEISIHSYSLFERNCVKVLCEKLLGMEQPLSCCKLSHVKCWRHSVESAKIEKFGGIEDDQSFHPNYLLDSLSSLAEGQEVRFRLNWEL